MPKSIQLNIAESCHEKWNQMTSSEKGRFCGSCQKQVVDFTRMSDTQVAAFFRKPSTGSVCGRFMRDQLDREMEVPRKRIPWLKYFFSIALPAFLMSSKAKAQGTVAVIKQDTVISPEPIQMGKVLPSLFKEDRFKSKKIIKGKITDEDNSPIPGASVMLMQGNNGTITDTVGNFTLLVDDVKDIVIVASFIGHQPEFMKIDAMQTVVNVDMKLYPSMTMGIVAVVVKKVVPNKELLDIPAIPEITVSKEIPKVKLFPNPVIAGNSLKLELSKELPEDYYVLDFVNPAGQSVFQREIWIDKAARLLNINTPAIKAGNYFLVISNKKTGSRVTEKLVIR